jgi:hypothetical protein
VSSLPVTFLLAGNKSSEINLDAVKLKRILVTNLVKLVKFDGLCTGNYLDILKAISSSSVYFPFFKLCWVGVHCSIYKSS